MFAALLTDIIAEIISLSPGIWGYDSKRVNFKHNPGIDILNVKRLNPGMNSTAGYSSWLASRYSLQNIYLLIH